MSEGTFATDNRTRHKVVFERTYRAPVILRYAEEWERIVTRLGRWVDFGDAYKTMERSYMESVMWAFGWLHELGLVYEGHKVVPYCTRCQTPLSNFEARLDDAYRPRTDLSCVVRFRLVARSDCMFVCGTTSNVHVISPLVGGGGFGSAHGACTRTPFRTMTSSSA